MTYVNCCMTGCFDIATKFSVSKYNSGTLRAYCATHFRYCFCGHLEKSISKEDYLARIAMEAL